MLTKNLLSYKIRADRIFPQRLRCDQEDILELAQNMLEIFNKAQGQSYKTINSQLDQLRVTKPVIYQGFKKLLLDRTESLDDDDDLILKKRTEYLSMAQNLLAADHFTIDQFYLALEQHFGVSIDKIKTQLYADLKENKTIKTFKSFTPIALIHRYNCAQIQGLLLRALTIRFEVEGAALEERRRLFQLLKFHRILVEHDECPADNILSFRVSGPLNIFQNVQVYGLRLANFFPYILHFKNWHMHAQIKINDKVLNLNLDQSFGIDSHYDRLTPYIPAEFAHFIGSFNQFTQDWQVTIGSTLVNFGNQEYCFPDFTFTHRNGKRVDLELFHNWHKANLFKRGQQLVKSKKSNFILGVCRSLKKERLLWDLDKLQDLKGNIFEFRDFPTPTAVYPILSSLID